MKRFLLTLVAVAGIAIFATGQANNDYRSRKTGDWNDPSTWERYNGTTWQIVNTSNFPVVAGTNTSTQTASTTHNVNLPTGIATGDLLLVFWADYNTNNATITVPTGWSTLYNGTNGNRRYAAFYKVADGTEGATLNFATNINEVAAQVSYRILAGSYTGTPVSFTGTVPTGNSTSPNPPSLTSGFGNTNTLWMATSHSGGTNTANAPANYGNLVTANTGNNNNTQARVAVATRERQIATEDPNNFTLGSAVNWTANTIAIRGTAIVGAIPTSAVGAITIRNSHTVTVTANVTADQVTVDAGGRLDIGAATFRLNNGTGTDLTVNGTLAQTTATSAITINAGANIAVNAGGEYIHARNGGAIPVATWNSNSTCSVTGITATLLTATSLNQTFGNFVWDCAGQTAWPGNDINPTTMAIQGDLIVRATGPAANLRDFAIDQDMTIGGNLIITGGIYRICYDINRVQTVNGNMEISGGGLQMNSTDNGNVTGTLNINSNVVLSGGSIDMSKAGVAARTSTINIGGHFTQTGGTITETGATIASTINFTGNAVQNFSRTGGNITENVNFAVASGATLQMADAATTITGTGSFTLANGATLGIRSANGINSTGTNGHILTTGGRTFSSGANYIYNGTVAQNSGVFTTSPTANQVNNLTINNAAGLTLERPIAVAGSAYFASGIIYSTTNSLLTFNDNATAINATNASFVQGPVRKIGNDDFTYPVGDISSGYHPIRIDNTSGLVSNGFTATYVRASANALGSSVAGLAVSACEYWNVERSGGISNPGVYVSWTAESPCSSSPYTTTGLGLVVAHLNGAVWEYTGNGTLQAAEIGSTYGLGGSGFVGKLGVSQFTSFVLGNIMPGENPLPVTFSDVKAYEKGAGVQIEWSNLTEKDVVNYVVERSVNGRDFSPISQHASRSNQNDKQSYTSFDASPVTGSNFYRIRVTEIDGKLIYSKLLRVDIGAEAKGFTVYPNPVVGNTVSINFAAAKGEYTLRVINAAGQQVLTQKLGHPGGNSSQSISLPSSVKSGFYTLQVLGDNYKESKIFVIH